jgi:hypothetical protein
VLFCSRHSDEWYSVQYAERYCHYGRCFVLRPCSRSSPSEIWHRRVREIEESNGGRGCRSRYAEPPSPTALAYIPLLQAHFQRLPRILPASLCNSRSISPASALASLCFESRNGCLPQPARIEDSLLRFRRTGCRDVENGPASLSLFLLRLYCTHAHRWRVHL